MGFDVVLVLALKKSDIFDDLPKSVGSITLSDIVAWTIHAQERKDEPLFQWARHNRFPIIEGPASIAIMDSANSLLISAKDSLGLRPGWDVTRMMNIESENSKIKCQHFKSELYYTHNISNELRQSGHVKVVNIPRGIKNE